MDAIPAEKKASAHFLALLHDRAMQTLAHFGRHLVDLVAAEDFDGLARGIQHHFAMAALAQVKLNLGARLHGDRFVDHIVENFEELSASHASAPSPSGAAAACAIAGDFLPK